MSRPPRHPARMIGPDAVPEVVWIATLNPEQVLYVNPAFERIWSLPVEALYRNPRRWTEIIHPDDRARVVERYTRWIGGENVDYDEVEYRIALPPGVLARADRVQATLYYQSIPPFFLQQRFADASVGPGHKDDIERLHYMTSHLNVAAATDESGEAVLEGWKIRITGDTQPVQ